MTHIISMANHKGGVGKTSSVQNIGAGLARAGHRVLLIDFDPQANLSDGFGYRDLEFGVFEAMLGEIDVPLIQLQENLSLIPSHIGLAGAEMYFSTFTSRERILSKTVIDKVAKDFDFILIDCPPSLGLLTINAFTASTEIYIPLDAEYFSMRGLDNLQELISRVKEDLNPALDITGVFFTKFDNRMVIKSNVERVIRAQFGEKVFDTHIRNNIAVAEAQAQGADVFSYDARCNGASDYHNLTLEVLQRHQLAAALTS
ncbi:MAG: ParA family protein [Saprospiraceae bacterium]